MTFSSRPLCSSTLVFLVAVCPAGTYEVGSRCARCPVGFYCPAGNGNDVGTVNSVGTSGPFDLAPEQQGLGGKRSFRVACGLFYTTRYTGSRDELACGKPKGAPGYLTSGPSSALARSKWRISLYQHEPAMLPAFHAVSAVPVTLINDGDACSS